MLCAVVEKNDVRGFVIMVESQHDPFYVDEKVEKFIRNIPVGVRRTCTNFYNNEFHRFIFLLWMVMVQHIVASLSNDEFKSYKKKVEEEKFSELESRERSEQYWHAVSNRYDIFDREKKNIEYLRGLRKEDVLAFFKVSEDFPRGLVYAYTRVELIDAVAFAIGLIRNHFTKRLLSDVSYVFTCFVRKTV